jgi:hypothetical protein
VQGEAALLFCCCDVSAGCIIKLFLHGTCDWDVLSCQ